MKSNGTYIPGLIFSFRIEAIKNAFPITFDKGLWKLVYTSSCSSTVMEISKLIRLPSPICHITKLCVSNICPIFLLDLRYWLFISGEKMTRRGKKTFFSKEKKWKRKRKKNIEEKRILRREKEKRMKRKKSGKKTYCFLRNF